MLKIHEDFIVDRKGKRKSVILPYREYEDLLEDLADLAVVAERRKDKTVTHKDFLAELKKDGSI
ncbi:MAG: hypothetical protein HY209_02800 [Candidatus Omnitrophica bacterium]|nr:hypothetical protein [Candidatus Omnitrophota bacterium]